MSSRVYVYIDGESHFIRTERAWRKLHGNDAGLDRLRYVGEHDERLILLDPNAKIFWTQRMNPGANRTYYFTSLVGDERDLYDARVKLRDFGLDHHVIRERSQLAKNRKELLLTESVIEKPKGVDIALTVQMLTDAIRGAFDVCHLYTSDVDYQPLIERVRAEYKTVFVHGYEEGVGRDSAFFHACDKFTYLDEMLRNQFELAASVR